MSWNKILIALLSTLLVNLTQASTLLNCPGNIKDNQHTHTLNDASLFEGEPSELADLMPDTDNETVWTLAEAQESAKARGTALYFVCRYKATDKIITLKVPGKAKKCSVFLRNKRTHATCK